MRVDWCVSSWFRIKNTHSLPTTVSIWVLLKAGQGGRLPAAALPAMVELKECLASLHSAILAPTPHLAPTWTRP